MNPLDSMELFALFLQMYNIQQAESQDKQFRELNQKLDYIISKLEEEESQ